MLEGTAPPERDHDAERARPTTRDARGGLPVLRANRARLRRAAAVPAVRLPARGARHASLHLPRGARAGLDQHGAAPASRVVHEGELQAGPHLLRRDPPFDEAPLLDSDLAPD